MLLEIILFLLYEAKHKEKNGGGVKILTPKEMLQRLPIALPQIKAGNNSESCIFFVSIKRNY